MNWAIPPLIALTIAVNTVNIHAEAQTQPRTPEVCAQVRDPDDRLSCYDQAFRTTEAIPSSSQWQVRTTTSQLDGSTRVVLVASSIEPIRSRFGAPGPANLMIRCEENTTSFFIRFNGLFMSDIQNYGRVGYRIDDLSPARVSMTASSSNEALGLWRGNASIPFIRRLFGHGHLYLRATPFNENRVEMIFPIVGLEEAITPLRQACNW